jgi:hypothetical protein
MDQLVASTKNRGQHPKSRFFQVDSDRSENLETKSLETLKGKNHALFHWKD